VCFGCFLERRFVLAVVEQQLKKRTEDKLVLGCFSCLEPGLTAGCGLKRLGKV
jgi:hypothetical protein